MKAYIQFFRQILYSITLTLLASSANGQDFQIIEEMRYLTHASDDGRVMVGFNENGRAIIRNGEISELNLDVYLAQGTSIRSWLVSGDGSSMAGHIRNNTSKFPNCTSASCYEIYHYDIEEKDFETLPYPAQFYSAYSIRNTGPIISATGDTVMASVSFREEYTSDASTHIIRWIDGIPEILKTFGPNSSYKRTSDATADMNTVVGSGAGQKFTSIICLRVHRFHWE